MPIPAFLFNPLVIKAIAVLAVIIGVTAWWNIHNYNIRQAAIKEYKVKLTACADQTTIAVNANKSLQASMQEMMRTLQAQHAEIAKLQTAEATARKARDVALAAALAKEASLRTEINRLTVIASAPAGPPSLGVCNEATDLLRSYAGAR